MKKLFVLAALFTVLSVITTASAQGGSDPQQMRQRMIERIKPQLVEKTKITDAEADKVLDVYVATQPQRREIRMDQSMSDEDKAKKIAAIEEEAGKKYKAIPLSDEKIKAVNEFFEEMRKNMRSRRNDGN